MALEPARRRGTSKRLTACLFARAQLDDYKAAERVRESKRDRSARERAQDDGAQAAQRKRSKRERLAAEEYAAAFSALPHVECHVWVRRGICPRALWHCGSPTAEGKEAAERDWQERVRASGRFVEFRVEAFPRAQRMEEEKRWRGGRPSKA